MLRCLSTMVLSFCFIFFVNICILLYIFPLSFWGVFPHFFYCVFRHHFWGENCYFFSLFQNSHIVFLRSLSLPYYVGEEEGRGRGRRGGHCRLLFWTMWRSNAIENVIHYYISLVNEFSLPLYRISLFIYAEIIELIEGMDWENERSLIDFVN